MTYQLNETKKQKRQVGCGPHYRLCLRISPDARIRQVRAAVVMQCCTGTSHRVLLVPASRFSDQCATARNCQVLIVAPDGSSQFAIPMRKAL